jgi:hypothetical protein
MTNIDTRLAKLVKYVFPDEFGIIENQGGSN